MFKNMKVKIGIISIIIFVFLIIVVPSFSKPKSLQSFNDFMEWDGSVASSFKMGEGTKESPYIISDAKELAYFSASLKEDDYKDKYVKLSNDIIINKGLFIRDGLKYIYDNNEYYIYGTKYYETSDYTNEVSSLNTLNTLDNFKGNFDGDYHTIYGLYLFGDDKALFTNLNGVVENLYVENALITDGYAQAGIVLNANNSTISNVVFDGSIINDSKVKEETIIKDLDDINLVDTLTLDLDKPYDINFSAKLSGKCLGSTSFKINDKEVLCQEFDEEIDPFNIVLESIDDISLTNLKYTLTYDKKVSAGIVLGAYNSTIVGAINKGYISSLSSAGIAGIIYNTNISNSYNKGIISGYNASGLINNIYNSSNNTLNNTYNVGTLSATLNNGLINRVVNSNLSITNSFNTFDSDAIGSNINSTINVVNSYNKKENLKFNLNEESINDYYKGEEWTIRNYPILKYDVMKDTIAQVKIDDNTYTSLGNNKDIYKMEGLNILLAYTNDYKPVKEAYYYVSHSYLDDLNNVNWIDYNNNISINDEGIYIIYFKVIDYNNNTYYINTDRYIIDYTPSSATIILGSFRYDEMHEAKSIYVKDNLTFEVITNNNINNLNSVEYFISDNVISDIENNNEISWNTYDKAINISRNNPYIIYVRLKDNEDNYTYINSDYIVLKYFNIDGKYIGNNIEFNSNISYNSSFNFDVSLNHQNIDENFNRYLKVNKELPNKTYIYLKDKINNKMYYLYVNNLNTNGLYSLSDFKEVGNINDIYFDNDNVNNLDEELYNIFVDFKDIDEVVDTYTFELLASNQNNNIYTLNNVSINLNNVETNLNNYLSVSTKKKDLKVIYNISDNINIPININVNNNGVINTNLENYTKGIKIELLDENNEVVTRDKYKNIKFELDGNYYYPSSDSVTYILTNNLNPNLIIHTSEDRNAQNFSNYYFKVSAYLSLENIDIYESNNSINLPLTYKSKYLNNNYNFDVSVNNSLIINSESNNNIEFNIKGKGKLTNPNIRLSLYKKKKLTAYNQEYELVDLKDYINEEFSLVDNNIYKVFDNLEYSLNEYSENTLNLSFKDIDINGYRFLFELYDGNNLVGKKYISVIVR